ncbi:hypothetical protein N665_0114s0056 [Sinapis alba]|nr:hypothetical protein N665_0114s0056 [Sinapis alba]
MPDWGPVFVAVALFVLLTPGVLIQIPGKNRVVEFGTFQTSGVSVIVHTLIYFTLVCILLLAIQIHIIFSRPIVSTLGVDFGNLKTNGKAIAVHTLIFFAIYSILIIAVNLHIYTG